MKKQIIHSLLFYPAMALCVAGMSATPEIRRDDALLPAPALARPAPGLPGAAAPRRPVPPAAGKLAQQGAAAAAAETPPEKTATLTRLATREENGEMGLVIEADGDLQFTAFKLANPHRLILDLPRAQAGAFSTPIPVNKGPLATIRPILFKEAGALRLEIGLTEERAFDVTRKSRSRLLIAFKPAVNKGGNAPEPVAEKNAEKKAGEISALAALTPAEPKAAEMVKKTDKPEELRKTGDTCEPILSGEKEKVSFDFQQADLRNILRIVAETGRFNMVLSPEVAGTVSMRLNNVPWNHALATILRNNGLERECANNIVRIASQAAFANEDAVRLRAKQNLADADKAAQNAEELFTEVVRLNYADSKELSANLTNLKTLRGKVAVDTRTNTIVVTDIRSKVNEMLNLVSTLDIQTPQVMIEARIVEVNKNATKELGIQWGGNITRTTPKEFPNLINVGPSTLTRKGFVVDMPTTSSPTGGLGLTLGSLTRDTLLDIQLAALETQGRGKVLSSPKVTTLDNKQAKIQSGRRIPYQTVSQDGTVTQFVDASISLTVTPHITADGNIHMRIQAQKNAADFSNSVNGVPTITTKEALTEVLVRNGETTVLGGLYESAVTESRNKVPAFADIPFLGALFRRFRDTDQVDELLIFITPVVVQNYTPSAK